MLEEVKKLLGEKISLLSTTFAEIGSPTMLPEPTRPASQEALGL
jgi:hypothetical protein